MRVLILQFLKGSWHYGELDAAEALNTALSPALGTAVTPPPHPPPAPPPPPTPRRSAQAQTMTCRKRLFFATLCALVPPRGMRLSIFSQLQTVGMYVPPAGVTDCLARSLSWVRARSLSDEALN
jgi:hypothetical protein